MPDPACPVCGKPAKPALHPFCSRGCRDRDLLQWLSDGYAIPVRAEESEDGLDSPDDRY